MKCFVLNVARVVLLAGVVLAFKPVQAAEAKRVFLITVRGCEEVCRSFRQSLAAQGAVDFIWRDIAGDLGRLPAFVAEARRLKPDLIATWGTGVTLGVVGAHDAANRQAYINDIPVVYMYVGNPVESGIAVNARFSGREHVAGANTAVPVEAQLNLMSSYRPLNRVGMVYNTNEQAAVTQAAEARQAFLARGIEVREEKLVPDENGKPRAGDLPAALARLAERRVDFLYYVGSTFNLQQVGEISRLATVHGLPLFSSAESAYRKGEILLGLISPLAGIGQVAGYQAGQILFHGKRAGDLPTPTLTRHSVLINMRAAHALRLYPPMKLLEFAEVDD